MLNCHYLHPCMALESMLLANLSYRYIKMLIRCLRSLYLQVRVSGILYGYFENATENNWYYELFSTWSKNCCRSFAPAFCQILTMGIKERNFLQWLCFWKLKCYINVLAWITLGSWDKSSHLESTDELHVIS